MTSTEIIHHIITWLFHIEQESGYYDDPIFKKLDNAVKQNTITRYIYISSTPKPYKNIINETDIPKIEYKLPLTLSDVPIIFNILIKYLRLNDDIFLVFNYNPNHTRVIENIVHSTSIIQPDNTILKQYIRGLSLVDNS